MSTSIPKNLRVCEGPSSFETSMGTPSFSQAVVKVFFWIMASEWFLVTRMKSSRYSGVNWESLGLEESTGLYQLPLRRFLGQSIGQMVRPGL